jgi:O-antigen/teichoic acid export membrane protein
VATLGVGSAGGQIVLFLASPVLLRLYTPADFGLFTLTYSAAGLLVTLCSWKIERLIVLVPSRRQALDLLTAVIGLAVTGSTTLLLVLLVSRPLVAIPIDAGLLWLLPLSVTMIAVSAGLRALAVRSRAFAAVATAQVCRSLVFMGGAIGTAVSWQSGITRGAMVMLIWQVIGDLAAVMRLGWAVRKFVLVLVLRVQLRQAARSVRRHGSLIAALGLSQLVCSINHQIPISVVAFVFGTAVAGLYSVANSLVAVPCSILATAIAEVVNQRLARLYVERMPIARVLQRTMMTTAVAGIGPFLALALLAKYIVPLLIGPQWTGAVPAVTILSLSSYLFFIEAPAGYVAAIVKARRYILVWQLMRCTSLTLSGVLAVLGCLSFIGWLILIAVLDGCLYVFEMLYVWSLTRKADADCRTDLTKTRTADTGGH